MVLQGHIKHFSCLISVTTRFMPTNLAKWWLTIRNLNQLRDTIRWTHGQDRSSYTLKTLISTTTMPLVTKSGRVVTYNEELPSIKSYGPLNTWSSDFDFSFLLRFVGVELQMPKSSQTYYLICAKVTLLSCKPCYKKNQSIFSSLNIQQRLTLWYPIVYIYATGANIWSAPNKWEVDNFPNVLNKNV